MWHYLSNFPERLINLNRNIVEELNSSDDSTDDETQEEVEEESEQQGATVVPFTN